MKAANMVGVPYIPLAIEELLRDIVGESMKFFTRGNVRQRSIIGDFGRVILGPQGLYRFVLQADPIRFIYEDLDDYDV